MPDLSESPAASRFLDLATLPLHANSGKRAEARADLQQRVEASPFATEAMLEHASSCFEKADRSIWRKKILPLLGTVAIIAVALVVGTTTFRYLQFRAFVNMVPPFENEGAITGLDRLVRNIPPEAQLLIFGDVAAEQKWKPLWESDRANPQYLQAYLEGLLSDEKEIPPDLIKQVEVVDPGNGYIATIAAGSLASSSIKRKSPASSASKRSDAPEWTIKDQARFDQAYEAFRKAAELPGFTDHSIALNRERLRHIPKVRDFLERASVVAYTASHTTQKIELIGLARLLAAKAATFDEAGDIEKFRECMRLWRWLVERSADSSSSLIDALVTRAIIQTPLKNFRDAAARLGLEDLSEEFRILDEQFEAEKEQRTIRRKEDDTGLLMMTKSSVMTNLALPMMLRQSGSPPVITADDLKPGRLTDHALLGQAHSAVAAIWFGLLLLGALLSRTVVPHASQLVARRLADLVSPRDRMMVFVVGILGPVALYLAVVQVPHLSAREWGMRITLFIVPSIQLVALTLLMINLTIALGATLTRKRLPMLATARRSWRRGLPWFGVACSMLLMIGCGTGHQLVFKYGLVLLLPALCWPLVFWLPRIFRKPGEPNLRRVAMHQVLVPVWAGAVIVSCLLFTLHRADELKWTQRDRLMAPDPETGGLARIEGVIAKQVVLELREMMETLPEL